MFIDWLGRLFEKIDRVAVMCFIIYNIGMAIVIVAGIIILLK